MQQFITLLQQHNVSAIADVRSAPYSKYQAHFNKEELQAALHKHGIAYVFLGKQLGGRPKNSKYYRNGQVVYDYIASEDDFKHGISRLLNGMQKYRIAIMCAEKDPLDCHRSILVCRHLKEVTANIRHILADGTIKTHNDIEQQLIKSTGSDFELFDEKTDHATLVRKAYEKRQQNIAYQTK